MLTLVTSNKVIEPIKGWFMHPEVSRGVGKTLKSFLDQKAKDNNEYVIFSFNPIIFRYGLLLKLKGERVKFQYMSGKKITDVMVDDLGYYVNSPSHFLDAMEKIQREIVDIRSVRRGGYGGN